MFEVISFGAYMLLEASSTIGLVADSAIPESWLHIFDRDTIIFI